MLSTMLLAQCATAAKVKVGAAQPTETLKLFHEWTEAFNKQNVRNESTTYITFTENLERSRLLDDANPLAVFGPNRFADLPLSEFRLRRLGNRPSKNVTRFPEWQPKSGEVQAVLAKVRAQGDSVDWRLKGAVARVKDQGDCGSCWAFSAVGAAEGAWAAAGHELVTLSEQEVVDCERESEGCNGGWQDVALEWIAANGVVLENDYPYTGKRAKKCDATKTKPPTVVTTGVYSLKKRDEAAIAGWVALHGPVAVAIDAEDIMTYNSGIITTARKKAIDHAVLIVGYGTEGGTPFWIVKNSWGPAWGEDGYFRVVRGENAMLIADEAFGALVDAAQP